MEKTHFSPAHSPDSDWSDLEQACTVSLWNTGVIYKWWLLLLLLLRLLLPLLEDHHLTDHYSTPHCRGLPAYLVERKVK